jgi:hypothetical protein
MATPKKAMPKPKTGRGSIYKGTDASAKGGNKKLPVLGGDPSMKNRPSTQRGLARANAVAADMRTKGKGLRGQVTTQEEMSPDEQAYRGARYKEFKGGKAYMGGASLKSTLTKAPKDARKAK